MIREASYDEAAWWWAQSTEDQRLALMSAVRAWPQDLGQEWALDPQASRRLHRVLADEITEAARQRHGVELAADRGIMPEWQLLPERAKAPWVQVLGEQFEPGSRGAGAAQAVRWSMAPPPFQRLPDSDQVNLLRQIAGEIETYLEQDPRWYSTWTPDYRNLAQSIRELEKLTNPPEGEPCALLWSHMSIPVRHEVLGDIARFASSAGRGDEVSAPVQRELRALARSVEAVLNPERSMVRD